MRKPFAGHIAKVEEEEGKPFLEVLRELASEGESKSSSAAILDIPQESLCKWLRNNPQPVEWPKKNQSTACKANVKNDTPARQAARLQNLRNMHAAKSPH
jgi:hypothetical protein